MGFPLIQPDVTRYRESPGDSQPPWSRWGHENNRAIEIHLIRMDARMVKVDASGTIDPDILPVPLNNVVGAYDAGELTPSGAGGDDLRLATFGVSGSVQAFPFSNFTSTIIDSADAATWRTAIGAQPLDATLTALAGANWAANAIPIGSGADTVAQVAFAANTFPGRSSAGNLVAKPITDFGFSLVDDANAAAAQTTLGLVIGTNVQAFDATLQALAGQNWQNRSIAVGTGSDTVTQLVLGINTIPAVDSGGTVFAADASDFTLTSLLVQNSAAGWRGAIGLEANANYVHIAGAETITGAKTFDGAFVFNEPGANVDARFEGDSEPNLIFLDASADAVGFGTNAPLARVQATRAMTVLPTTGGYAQLEATGTTVAQRLALGVLTATDGSLTAGTGVIQALVNASAFTNLAISPLGGNTGFGTGTGAINATVHNGGSYVQSGIISPAQITANTDNYAPTGLSGASILRLSTDASRNLTGITAGASGRRITIFNVGAQNIVFVHDATSTAANRFLCPGSVNFTLNANDAIDLWYDTTSSRWRLVAA